MLGSPQLLAGAGAALVAIGAVAAAATTPQTRATAKTRSPSPSGWALEQAAGLPLEHQVGQLVVGAFEGPQASRPIKQALRAKQLSGVILFAGNVRSETQLRRLSTSLQRAAGGSTLVSVDQEGGLVRRIPFAAPRAGQRDQGGVAQVRHIARHAAMNLSSLGVNVNYAPVADVASHQGATLFERSFAGSRAAVARKVVASVGAYRAGNVAATVKHFPGLGAARRNTDDAAVVIRRTVRQLRRVDLVPFQAAVDAQVPLLMASHALYPALDKRRVASQSRRILDRLLRGEMSYRGAVITDALEASAVTQRMSVATAAERSLLAGCDLLLLTRPSNNRRVFRHLLSRARRSPAMRTRVQEAAARVIELKQLLGLHPSTRLRRLYSQATPSPSPSSPYSSGPTTR